MSDEKFLYLITTGHKSGTPHEIEIWYVPYEDGYYMISEHEERSHWVQNIQHSAAIQFKVATRATRDAMPWMDGTGRIVNRDTEPALAQAVAALMDEKYEWSKGVMVEVKTAQAN